MDTEWGQAYLLPLVNSPGVWFFINICFWLLIGYFLQKMMSYLAERATGVVTVRFKCNKKLIVEKLYRYLDSKHLAEEEASMPDGKTIIKKVNWVEKHLWPGQTPKIEITYDEQNEFLLAVYIQMEKSGRANPEKVKSQFLAELESYGIFARALDPITEKALKYQKRQKLNFL